MSKIVSLSACIALLAPAALSQGAATVSVKDNFFSPKSITVSKGEKVKFVWRGRNSHNVRGNGASSALMRSGSYSKSFRKSGIVFCSVHDGMTMKVRVK
ncbi:MAG: hypothetical protein H0V29_03165 [Thermoleophilaceae bacterium]|nr:hypothetical protein [Thermoleophilaceae bacterium]